jgi:hypothetical protein
MQGKINYQMVVVKIRINIGITLKKIKTKGRKVQRALELKCVRVKGTKESKGRKGQRDARVPRTQGSQGRNGPKDVRVQRM